MPQAPRPSGKAKKIAYDILGTPANMRKSRRRTIIDRNRSRIERDYIRSK